MISQRTLDKLTRVLLFAAICLLVAGCADLGMHSGSARTVTSGAPAIASATFCEVMAAQGGAFLWSKSDTRLTKERADRLNAAWKLCPQYRPPTAAKTP